MSKPLIAALCIALAPRARAASTLPNAEDLGLKLFGQSAPAVAAPLVKPRPRPTPGSYPRFMFSDTGADVSAQIAAAIDGAGQTIDAALYTLTLPNVADALVRAKSRGVAVRVIYDYGHGSSAAGGSQPDAMSAATEKIGQLRDAGIDVRLLRGMGSYGIMHNKFAIIDSRLLETGSFNWTTAANDKNRENALFRDDASLIADYQKYFDWMWTLARPMGAAQVEAAGAPPACASGPTALGRTWPQCSFSPNGPTEQLLADAISRARTRVHIAMFSFTSQAVVDALIAAKKNRVDMLLIFDRSQSHSSGQAIAQLAQAGIAYKIGTGYNGGVLHDKFAVIDDLLETGSFNYTTNASKNNYENAFFSNDGADVAGFEDEFQKIYATGTDQ